jgi:hypothetical protein
MFLSQLTLVMPPAATASPNLPLDSPLAVVGAVEAMIGLLIEASFIATFTQRFFGK